MQTMTIAAASRTQRQKAAKHLLSAGKIPAVVYGHGAENRAIEVDAVPFRKLLAAAGESTLVDLSVDGGAPTKVLIHDLQHDPLKDVVTHVDFLQVDMAEKITVDIPLVFTGESMAVKGLGGTFVKNHDALQVECLPGDLVHEIAVDIAPLATFDDAIRVKDVAPPKGIVFTDAPNEVVAFVQAPRSEEEMKALEGKAEISVETVAVAEKGKKEEEGAEGEASAAKPAAKKE